MEKLLLCSVVQLAKMIREKQVSCEEVVKTYIDQAKKVNPLLNAIVVDCYGQAMKDAREVDLFLKSDPDTVPPLLGIPFTIKESYQVKGMPCTFGSVHKRDNISKEDDFLVARLRAAGAIPLGVTNVPLVLLSSETINKVYGRTSNPYDLKRNAGGSSGGEAAIISSAGSSFGIGSDGGGSVRGPANFCGIYGHKSSPRLIREAREIPNEFYAKICSGLCVDGPLTRYSEDLMPLLRIMAGDLGETELGDESKVDIKSLDFYCVQHEGLHPTVKKAYDEAIVVLKNEGITFSEISEDKYMHAENLKDTHLWNSWSLEAYMEVLGLHDPKDLYRLLEREKKYADTDFEAFILTSLIQFLEQSKDDRDTYLRIGRERKEQFDHMLGPKGIIISPVRPHPAVIHGEYHRYAKFSWMTGIYNVMENAATAIPMGLSEEGLPVGIQAISVKGNDHLTIAIAKFFESKGYGWTPPKMA